MRRAARVAKGTITTMSCDPATNGFTMTGNNTGTYVLGPGGEELTQLSGSGAWQRTNVFGGGKQLATYDSMGLHFQIEDALGTRRMQTNADGQPETDIQSLPYGDALVTANDQYAPATADDATPLHFTGKERDTESGNDYFGARYYASSHGPVHDRPTGALRKSRCRTRSWTIRRRSISMRTSGTIRCHEPIRTDTRILSLQRSHALEQHMYWQEIRII